jgi:uncharacterized protein (TIGR03000 family)
MFRKTFSFGGLLLLAGAVVFATPGRSQAQRGGGGHAGGGHFGGGAHFGGAHFGGTHFGGTHLGGVHLGGYGGGIYHGGIYHGGYHYGHPYAHYGYRHFYPYYGSYGYSYPYYGSYGYSYPYYDTYPYAWSSPTYDGDYSNAYGYAAPYYGDSATSDVGSYQGFDSLAPVGDPSDNTAHLTVNVPANARVWFSGVLTTSTGPVREFQSPPLTAGHRYDYEVRARWNENGHEVTQTQHVPVTPGAHVRVDFPTPSGTAAQASTKE